MRKNPVMIKNTPACIYPHAQSKYFTIIHNPNHTNVACLRSISWFLFDHHIKKKIVQRNSILWRITARSVSPRNI